MSSVPSNSPRDAIVQVFREALSIRGQTEATTEALKIARDRIDLLLWEWEQKQERPSATDTAMRRGLELVQDLENILEAALDSPL